MRIRIRSAALVALAFTVESCSDNGTLDPVVPGATPLTSPALAGGPLFLVASTLEARINEIHYDNAGTDTGERIEVSAPAGISLAGWTVVLYNGSGGAPYGTLPLDGSLDGTTTATCTGGDGTRVVVSVPALGLQNGPADGIALVKPGGIAGDVVEFLSYEGTFRASDGPAIGILSTDIGVSETGSASEPAGLSLQRNGDGGWSAGPNSFGQCNSREFPLVAAVTVSPATATVVQGATQSFTASGFDAANQPVTNVAFTWTSSAPTTASVNPSGVAAGLQAGEVTITATSGSGIKGTASLRVNEAPPPPEPPSGPVFISEIHYDNAGGDTGEAIEVEFPAGMSLAGWSLVLYNGNGGGSYGTLKLDGTVTGTITATCTGGSDMRAVVTVPALGLQNGPADGIALAKPPGTAAAAVVEFISYEGQLVATNGLAKDLESTDIGFSQSGDSRAGLTLQRDAEGWYGLEPASFGACNIAPPPSIKFRGRDAGGAPLPVGFEDQLFADLHVRGKPVLTTITWLSETPGIASIEQNGLVRALGAGTVSIRATAADGTAGTTSFPTLVATEGGAQYANHLEFGEPTDRDAGDDYLVRYKQYTASYSKTRGTPNWVSYNLEASHFGGQDRCNCFTFDRTLPAEFARYTTADYTDAGKFHGYDIDRGHLARSFDRTSGSLDNARTFYFTNIIPQASEVNQGPWAEMETYLGDLARFQNKEVYVVTGVAGSRGTIKDQGTITIPATVWKVAVVLARDKGLPDIHTYEDATVIAVVMPNDRTVNADWTTYKTTVDEVERVSGYDLLDRLDDQIEIAVESNTRPPVAAVDGPYDSMEGEAVAMSAAASSDPDGDALTYAWSFGDGGTATGVHASHTYATGGRYTVRVEVTDIRGLKSTATTTATVITRAAGVQQVIALVEQLTAAGMLPRGTSNSLTAKLDAAKKQLERGQLTPAVNQLEAFLHEVDALVNSDQLSGASAASLRTGATRVIRSVP